MTPEELEAFALHWLKQCRVPLDGALWLDALASPEALGARAYHAAHLLQHARVLRAQPAAPELASHTLAAGAHLALLQQAQEPTYTAEDLAFTAKAKTRADAESYGWDRANAERAIDIDSAQYDALIAQHRTQEQIAEHFGCSLPTLSKWRRRNSR